eukprot:CAMPEP_0177695450 /NCGR_PEP_ID=MMETSP0484_2-20121128/3462_1 /TAXON_ID=354590 /ORGANISM="Rhodomonas lens, Strain RHODO" /LENGTH=481 /DNA_ID=CAMNT_0019206373 /DNA_START=195 /DNA_END=1636 /DNA_ORIENTATION=+
MSDSNSTPSKRLANKIPGMAGAMQAVQDKFRATQDGGILRRHSGAADVIVIHHRDEGRYVTSDFHVHAGRDAKLGQSMGGVTVEVFVNEKKTPLSMLVQDDYRCAFEDGTLRPSSAHVAALSTFLVPGRNVVRYQLNGDRALFDINACIFLWQSTDKLVVCDIDGTVTRSDLLGYSAHLLGYEYTHDGVTDVLCYLYDAGYKILFLTARPITVADRTRDFLCTVGQHAKDDSSQSFARLLGLHTSDTVLGLPPGALITTAERWVPAILIGLSPMGPQKFKTGVLSDVRTLFGGREDVFVGGFGNRKTDSGAYRAAGISPSRIFLVDDSSRVYVGKMDSKPQYTSYAELSDILPQFFPSLHSSSSSSSALEASLPADASSSSSSPLSAHRSVDGPSQGATGGVAAEAVDRTAVEDAFRLFGLDASDSSQHSPPSPSLSKPETPSRSRPSLRTATTPTRRRPNAAGPASTASTPDSKTSSSSS